LYVALVAVFGALASVQAAKAQPLVGYIRTGDRPIVKSTVTLWSAGPHSPKKRAQATSGNDGRFELEAPPRQPGETLYLLATGGSPPGAGTGRSDPAIVLMATLGEALPKRVTVNELTTVASVWTAAQFLDGTALSGNALGLKIAARNVPNLVDLPSGTWGPVIQDGLNSSQTTTLAIFDTLGDLLAGCIARVRDDACAKLFAATIPPGGSAPANTLAAAENVAQHPANEPGKLFALLDTLYPIPHDRRWRPVPYMPYLAYAPPSWTLALVYAGGGLNSLGGIGIDADGNAWAGDNFLVGSQSTLYTSFGGGVSEVGSSGSPLSPMTLGFRGGGVDGPGFGLAVTADRVWVDSLAGKSVSVFDRRTGKPLSPPAGYTFNGQLGSMQGIIATPSGDIWALDNDNSQVVYFPNGDPARARILCRRVNGKPTDGTCSVDTPFQLAIDQQNRIWITNSGNGTVTRFPAGNPADAQTLKVQLSPTGIAVDSQGNVWVNNSLGTPSLVEKLTLVWDKITGWVKGAFSHGSADQQAVLFRSLYQTITKFPGGNVTLFHPDGTEAPGSPFDGGKSIIAPWGIAVDGNDNIWVANATGRSFTELCGVRTQTCPPGSKVGDPISPVKTGYFGQGLQILTDIAIDPAGNVWLANNWDQADVGMSQIPDPALSTRMGGDGFIVFFGLAKPVKTPLIGPVRGW
jgi:sugar lactone lactonase YvrE